VAHRTGGWKGGLATLERAVSPFNLGTASSIKIESMNQTRKFIQIEILTIFLILRDNSASSGNAPMEKKEK
jgi:hypothetical protein